jgi:hypothetical protein
VAPAEQGCEARGEADGGEGLGELEKHVPFIGPAGLRPEI